MEIAKELITRDEYQYGQRIYRLKENDEGSICVQKRFAGTSMWITIDYFNHPQDARDWLFESIFEDEKGMINTLKVQ